MSKHSFKLAISSILASITLFASCVASPVMAKEIEVKKSDYGYGKYTVTVRGVGYDGVYDEESVVFYYLPIEATYEINPITGEYDVKILSAGDDVNSVDVYLEDEYLGSIKRSEFESGKISFSLAGKPTGTYTIMVVAKDAYGNMIYTPIELSIDYTSTEVPDAGAPDTGGLFKNLNISNEDYITTGLIMFFVLGIVALGIVFSGRRGETKKHR